MTEKNKFKLPHVYVLLFLVMLFVLLITYIVPSGEFVRVIDPNSGREVIDPATYHITAKTRLNPMDFFTAIHKGFTETRDIIAMLLVIAGALGLIEKTGAIGAGVYALVDKTKGMDKVLLVILTALFSLLGGIGFAEGGSVFVPLAITLSLALGYDRMVGAGAGILGLCVGFSAGFLNIYTTGVSQSILGLPLYSGIQFRLIIWVISTVVACFYVLSYANKIKKDPNKSIYGKAYIEQAQADTENKPDLPFTAQRILILIAFLLTIIAQIYGTIKLGWYLPQLSAIYLMLLIVVGIIAKMNANTVATEFAKGASGILPAALAIALARAVLVVMNEGKILDTIINSLAAMLNGKNPVVIVIMIYCIVVVFNFFVTSGSGKAVILMPILGPLGQFTNINQQVIVVAYQMGDGFTNYFWPTAGTLMASLALAGVNYEDWFKFSYKFFIIATILGGVATVAAQLAGLGPF